MSNQQFDTALKSQLAALPKGREPQRDLWQGIELALANEATPNELAQQDNDVSHSRPVWFASAAAVALVGFISWFGVQQIQGNVAGGDLVAALSTQHEEQKNALLVKFQDQPALTQNWKEQLNELDEAAEAIKAALEEDPDNMALLKMLQNVHQQQIYLIERVHSPKWQQI